MLTAQASEAAFNAPAGSGVSEARGYYPMIYYVHGPDRLLAREAVRRIADKVDPDGSNTSWIDGREFTPHQIVNTVGTPSFFGEPRVVVVTDLLTRSASDASGEGNSAGLERQSVNQSSLGVLLSAVPESQCLIILEPTLTAPPAPIRSWLPPITIVGAEPPRGTALLEWLENAARRAESRIDRRSAQLLAETLFPQTWDRKPSNPRYDRPPDLALLTQEVEKLAVAAHPDPIGIEHIQQLVEAGPDQRMFRFQDAVLGADLRLAISELERLEAAGEEPAMLLSQLLGQIELSAVAAAANNMDGPGVARDLGSVTTARMSAVMTSTRRLSSTMGAAVASGVTVDRNLKTGRVRRPADALRHLIFDLAPGPPE